MPAHPRLPPSRLSSDDSGQGGVLRYVIAFDILHGVALSLLVAIFITAMFSSRIRRLPTWYSFILAFIVLSASNLILLSQQMGNYPSKELCHAQAILIYAAPVWTAASGVAFLLQIFMHAYNYLNMCGSKVLNGFLYHLIPFLLYLGIIAETTVLSLKYPESIVREQNGLYCHSTHHTISKISGGIAGGGTIIILLLGVTTAFMLYRSWNEFKRLKKRTGGGISVTLLIRIGLFTLASVVVLGISSSKFLTMPWNEGPVRLITAAVPLCTALTIGLQGDILKRWMFWKKYEDPSPTFAMEESSRATRSVQVRSTLQRNDQGSEYGVPLSPPTPKLPPSVHNYSKSEYGGYNEASFDYGHRGASMSTTNFRQSLPQSSKSLISRDSVVTFATIPPDMPEKPIGTAL